MSVQTFVPRSESAAITPGRVLRGRARGDARRPLARSSSSARCVSSHTCCERANPTKPRGALRFDDQADGLVAFDVVCPMTEFGWTRRPKASRQPSPPSSRPSVRSSLVPFPGRTYPSRQHPKTGLRAASAYWLALKHALCAISPAQRVSIPRPAARLDRRRSCRDDRQA